MGKYLPTLPKSMNSIIWDILIFIPFIFILLLIFLFEGIYPYSLCITQLSQHPQPSKYGIHMLTYKCWYYTQAMEDGNEDKAKSLTPDDLPDDIRTAYDNSHGQFHNGK